MKEWVPDPNYPDGTSWDLLLNGCLMGTWVAKSPSGDYTARVNQEYRYGFRTLIDAAKFVEKNVRF